MEEYLKRLSLYTKPSLSNVKELTSAEYYYYPDSHLSTHETFVHDSLVVSTYSNWIKDNDRFIKGKIVLDVGCGTGLLSMMAAKAGAARVIALEWSHMAKYTKKVIEENKLQGIVTVVEGTIEQAVLPDGIEKVDTIISMWIGYSLLHGGRIKRVLYARDKWLKTSGVIIPDRAELFISAITDPEYMESMESWKNVYGFDMSSVVDETLTKCLITELSPDNIVTNKCRVKNIDLRTDSYSVMTDETPFTLTAIRNDFVQGYCTFFTVKFSLDVKHGSINTDPRSDSTNWNQTCFYLPDSFMICRKEKINGTISMFGVNNDSRFLGFVIGTCFNGELDEAYVLKTYILRS